jgi:alpha-tubulin suppressor-like RCC1 family protein
MGCPVLHLVMKRSLMAAASAAQSYTSAGPRSASLAMDQDNSPTAFAPTLRCTDNADVSLITNTVGVIDYTSIYSDVEAGGFHSLVSNSAGQVFTWEKNSSRQLGLGYTNIISTPKLISPLNQVKAISAGHGHSLFLTDDGSNRSCYGSGDNGQGQLTQPMSNATILTPVMIDSYTDVDEENAEPHNSLLIRANQWVKIWEQMPDDRNVNGLEIFSNITVP